MPAVSLKSKLIFYNYLVNWNILVTKRKEINKDFESSGERNHKKITCGSFKPLFDTVYYNVLLFFYRKISFSNF